MEEERDKAYILYKVQREISYLISDLNLTPLVQSFWRVNIPYHLKSPLHSKLGEVTIGILETTCD